MALTIGDIDDSHPVLTRIHSECLTGDVFQSLRCDCGEQLHRSLELIGQRGRGVLVYLRQEGRGIGLYNKIRAYQLQEQGHDTVSANLELGLDADSRHYQDAISILSQLGVHEIELLTNNPEKISAFNEGPVRLVKRHPLEMAVHPSNKKYLLTKRDQMGHLILKNPPAPREGNRERNTLEGQLK